MIEQAKLTYFPLEKVDKKLKITIEYQGEKQRQVTEEHGKKQIEALQALELNNQEPKKTLIDLVKERTKEIGELEKKNDCDKLLFVTTKEILYSFNGYRKPSILFYDITKS